jgi:hypothetical protein
MGIIMMPEMEGMQMSITLTPAKDATSSRRANKASR